MPELSASGAALGALAATAVFATLVRGASLALVYPLMRRGSDRAGRRRSACPADGRGDDGVAADRPADHRSSSAAGRPVGVLWRRDQRRRAGGQRLRHGIRPGQGTDAARRAVVPAVCRGDEPRADRRRRLRLPVLLGVDVAGVVGAGRRPPHRSGKPAGRPSLSRDGGDRHGGAAVRLRRARRAGRRLCLRHDPRPSAPADGRRPGAGGRARSAAARRAGWFRCMPGCRSPIRRRRATSPR